MDGLETNVQTGENVQEAAAPVVTDNANEQTPASETQQSAAEVVKEPQSQEVNAQFAAARRKAEEEYNTKISGINDEFKRLFGNMVNPVTGKKIETYQDYIQAVEHQKVANRNQMLQEKGIDPNLIEQMINDSPAMRQAQQILEESQKAEAQRRLEIDLKSISEIAPEIKSIDDLEKHESCADVLAYVERGLTLLEAFKMANFDKLSTRNVEAAKQAAVNQARSKNHMETTNSISTVDNSKDIPLGELEKWQAFFPGATMQELREKYNRVNK